MCNLAVHLKFQDLISYATCIISNAIIPLIFALALVLFVWGNKFVINNDEQTKKKKVDSLCSGVSLLFRMVSVWGLGKL